MTTVALTADRIEMMNPPAEAPLAGAVLPPVRWLLRLEGLGLLLAALVFYARLGQGWGRFAILFLVPDVSLAAYLVSPQVGARIYNAVHSTIGPLLLAIVGLLFLPTALPFALIWLAHVGFDRALGYGLKYPDDFHATHLGRVGHRPRGA
jgi:hypothetical protein